MARSPSCRSAAARPFGSCGASRSSAFGASGAGPSRKYRSDSASSRSESHAAADFMRRYASRRSASSSAASSGLRSARSAAASGKSSRALISSIAPTRTRNSPQASRSSLLLVLEPLGERRDDVGHLDLGQAQLLLEDERQQQVERALERVEVEVQHGCRHPREASEAGGRVPWGRPWRGLRAATPGKRRSGRARGACGRTATR